MCAGICVGTCHQLVVVKQMTKLDERQSIVFVYSDLSVGGVETLIVRLSKWMVDEGHRVTILLERDSVLDELLDGGVNRIYGVSQLALLVRSRSTVRARYEIGRADLILAPDPRASWMVLSLAGGIQPDARLLNFIFHPRIYFFRSGWRNVLDMLYERAFRFLILKQSLFFMNEACRRSHADHFGVDLSEAHILPLPVSVECGPSRPVRSRRIVSIGRLTSFKTYNVYMMDVVKNLVDRGFNDVKWDVYGDGPLLDGMRKRIGELGIEANVQLHGTVPYESLADVLDGAEIFVGMGTSLIEACARGLPGIPAIDSEGATTYGFFHDMPGYEVGECLGYPPGVGISDLIEKTFLMDMHEYESLCADSFRHCRRFSLDQVAEDLLAQSKAVPPISEFPEMSRMDRFLGTAYLTCVWVANGISKALILILKTLLPDSIARKLKKWNRDRHVRMNSRERAT